MSKNFTITQSFEILTEGLEASGNMMRILQNRKGKRHCASMLQTRENENRRSH